MEYEITELISIRCFGIEKHITKENKKENTIFNDIWKSLMESVDYKKCSVAFGTSKNFKMDTQEFDYMACVKEGTPVLSDFNMQNTIIPGGRYAKFKFKGVMNSESVEKFYNNVFTFSMTAGTLIPDMERGINSLELYDESYRGMDNPESVFYLLIPIK